MAQITRYPFARHLRAEANQFILHHRSGKLVRKGAGLSYWFNPLNAAIAQVPAEDCETTFMLNERSADLQDVSVQVTLVYRFATPERAAQRVNFSISLTGGQWLEQPLQRMASALRQRAQAPARLHVTGMRAAEAMARGAESVRAALEQALRSDAELADMGLALVSVQVDRISPVPDLEKALQAPAREAIQQKADEAAFGRRALAVEKERAIKENELATEIELARRQEELIARQGANKLRAIQEEAASEQARVQAELERQALAAAAQAEVARVHAEGEAKATRMRDAAELEGERARATMWAGQPSRVQAGLAFQQLASHLHEINGLTVTPEIVASLQSVLRDDRNARE